MRWRSRTCMSRSGCAGDCRRRRLSRRARGRVATLRLRGVYFVVFTFGLTELVHQVLNWWEININGTTSRYIFTDVSNVQIYLTLLGIALVTIVGSWYVSQIRLGFALRAIGEDETVARHTGVNTTLVKVLCFALVRFRHGARRRRARAALSLYRREHRLQQHVVVPGPDRGAARRRGPRLGAGARRRPAGAAVGLSRRHLPASLQHRARPVLCRDRLFPAGRSYPACLDASTTVGSASFRRSEAHSA
jgi:hypothetical protein